MSNTIMNALTANNRFANVKITGDQIGVDNFETWKTMLENLHRSAYSAYVVCENSGLTAESVSIDKTAVFDAIKPILSVIGDVNGHKLYANAEMAVAMIAYSGRRANKDAGELQLINSQISNTKKAIAVYEKINVADKAFKESKLAEMNAALEKLIDEKDALLEKPDMRIKQPTRTTFNAFRLDVEHFLARTISGQLAKTLEELDAEEAARKEARKAAAKARKAKKANANTTK